MPILNFFCKKSKLLVKEELKMRLNELMAQSGDTQYKIAELLNVSRSAVYKYQQEKAEPDIESLIKLADHFGCSVDYLIGHQTANTLQLEGLTDDQKQLISIVQKLDARQTAFAIGYFSDMLGLSYTRPF